MTNAETLLKKGKERAAEYVQWECMTSKASEQTEMTQPPTQLQALLDHLLFPTRPINDSDTLEWCRWIVCGGESPEDFSRKVQEYNMTGMCGLVWTANFVAYRCSTCGISQCMSLCAECFRQGNHEAEGHDYNMFKSLAGGACDCGDSSVMRPSGFCSKHGPCKKDAGLPPRELMIVSENSIPRIVLRLIHHLRQLASSWKTLRENAGKNKQEKQLFDDMNEFITILHEYCNMGSPMRDIITRCLIGQQIYRDLATDAWSGNSKMFVDYAIESFQQHRKALLGLPSPKMTEPFCECPALTVELSHQTFLDELLFWTVKYEFPQKLVCLLLNLLPDMQYKNLFTRAFVSHYSRMSTLLDRSGISDSLSNRVIHVSVQLFSNEELTLRMSDQLHLLHIIVFSIKNMLNNILTKSILMDTPSNNHFVVDCGEHIMKEHCYWPLVSDLNNVLSHPSIAYKFMDDEVQLRLWFDFLPLFQGMNVNHRITDKHIEFEPNTYYAAFSAELESSAVPMWSLVSHLKDVSTRHLALNVIRHSLSALEKWLNAIGFERPDQVERMRISFHLPLHRYFSVFARQAARYQDLPIEEILPDMKTLQLLMMHPLSVQAAFYEVSCQMWVRNGLQIKGQAMTYIQCHFSNSMVDADMFLLQICAAKIDAAFFLNTIMDRFHVLSFTSLDENSVTPAHMEKDQEGSMMESFLIFLVSLLTLRTNLGLSEKEVTRLEMITLLCMENKTHSTLAEQMPEKNGNNTPEAFEDTLREVGVFTEPRFEAGGGTMQQGCYSPAPHVWEELYDPIYVLLRAFHRKDYQCSMDRYNAFMKNIGKSNIPLWPPWRLPKPCFANFPDPRVLLHSRYAHGLVLNLLYKAVYCDSFTEDMASLTVFLLELALSYPQTDFSGKEVAVSNPWIMYQEPLDLQYDTWFPTDCLFDNLRHTVGTIFASNSATSETNSMEVDQVFDPVSSEMDEETPYLVETPNSESQEAGSSPPRFPTGAEASGTTDLPPLPALTMLKRPGNSMHSSGALIPYTEGAVTPVTSLVLPNSDDQCSGSATTSILSLSEGDGSLVPLDLSNYEEAGPSQGAIQTEQEVTNSSKRAVITMNESIISLMLKLHSKLSGKPDSYTSKLDRSKNPDLKHTVTNDYAESRIGNGCFFVEKVLDKIGEMNSACEQNIRMTKREIWPFQNVHQEDDERRNESDELEAKKRRAKERQAKMIQEIAEKQKKFMNTLKDEHADDDSEMEGVEAGPSTRSQQVYYCGNCHQSEPSTADNPMGLIILLQATSVLGHRHIDTEQLVLPTSEEGVKGFGMDDSLATEYHGRYEEMSHNFNQQSYLMSVNSGWLGGVNVQSCGHYVHLECHQRYISTLKAANHPQTTAVLAVDVGEYYCPLCRQLSNSVLPIPPETNVQISRSMSACAVSIGHEVGRLLKEPPYVPDKKLLDAMILIMDHLSKATYPRYINHVGDHHAVILFVSSIARTNLELEIVLRGGSLVTPSPPAGASAVPAHSRSKSCFQPLFNVLSTYIKYRISRHLVSDWSLVSGLWPDKGSRGLFVQETDVPILLRDVNTLLLHFALVMPSYMDRVLFTCIVRQLYNLCWMQACLKLACRLPTNMRMHFRDSWNALVTGSEPESYLKVDTIQHGVGLVSAVLDRSGLFAANSNIPRVTAPTQLSDNVTLDDMEFLVQTECLIFMRIAALVRHFLFHEGLPNIPCQEMEFTSLAQFLGMADMDLTGRVPSGPCLGWLTSPRELCYDWCKEVHRLCTRNSIAARRLATVNNVYQQPRLLKLPKSYDAIFQFYYKRKCPDCRYVPKDPSLCLLCGEMVCLRENCCKADSGEFEAVSHSIECGAGTAPFLAVNSATIVVVRGRRACIWGSLYLDSFGEEDRELKRGKPLFLSQERYQLLQSQWLAHRFNHTNRKWIWHKDQLTLLHGNRFYLL